MADNRVIHNKRDLISKAKSSQFLVVIVASVIVSASLIGIKILWSQRSFQLEIIDAKTKARDQLEANIAAVEQLEAEFQKLEQSEVTSSLVLDALPSKYDFPALASSIEKIAALSDVKLESFAGDDKSAEAENSSGQPQPVPMEFNVVINGDYDNVKKFVKNLMRSIRPFHIDEISFEANGGNVQTSIKAKTFYVPAKNLEIGKMNISSQPQAPGAPGQNPADTPAGTAAPSDVPAGVDTSGVPQ